jgi:hypothetical protein
VEVEVEAGTKGDVESGGSAYGAVGHVAVRAESGNVHFVGVDWWERRPAVNNAQRKLQNIPHTDPRISLTWSDGVAKRWSR